MQKRVKILIAFLFFVHFVSAQADLAITGNINVIAPTPVHVGTTVTVTFGVKNIGNTTAGNTQTAILISSPNNSFSTTVLRKLSMEPLAPQAQSDNIQVSFVVPYMIATNGDYNIIVNLNYDETISETDHLNNIAGTVIHVSSAQWAAQNIPYPIIFVHGYMSSGAGCWRNMINFLQTQYGWSYGGEMDFCLNADQDLTTSNIETDYHDFTNESGHILNTNPCDFYTINFAVNPDGSTNYSNDWESNQAAIVKQGRAIQDAIKHVLAATGKDRVILVCHSMGGLAAREYLQNPNLSQANDGKKHVAKLCTIGTPHGGTDIPAFNLGKIWSGDDENSEAIRDLRTDYSVSHNQGVYLFSGKEDKDYMKDIDLNDFHNVNVNCNGTESGESITGINNKSIPLDLTYSCVIGSGDAFPINGDGVVTEYSANINNFIPATKAQEFTVPEDRGVWDPRDPWHIELTNQFEHVMKAIDEPSNDFVTGHAFNIALGQLYCGNITYQSVTSPPKDNDGYIINVASTGSLNIQVENIQTSIFSIEVFNSSKTSVYSIASNGKSYLNTEIPVTSGNYYIVLSGIPTTDSYKYPYAFKCTFSNNKCTPPSITQQPISKSIVFPGTISFDISAPGSNNKYQWQINTGTGWSNLLNNLPYLGVYSTTLSISNTTIGMNGYQYRCYITSSCTANSVTSNSAILTVSTSSTSCDNDYACSPKPLTITASCILTSCTTIGATPPSPGVAFTSCSGVPYQSGRYDDDVWFSITPTNTNPVTIKVIPTSNLANFDIVTGLYTGNCSSLIQVGCADNNPSGYAEDLVFTPVAGTTYLIRVFGYGISGVYSGNFDICARAPGQIDPNPSPDLAISNTNFSGHSLCAGGTVTTTYQIENTGTTSATSSTVKYYLSYDNTYSANDVLMGSTAVSSISSNGSVSKSKTLNIPAGTGTGSSYILIIADADDNVSEGTNGESNNVYAESISINNCGLPDIVLNVTNSPQLSGTPGDFIHVDFECTNTGNVTSPGARVGFYISTDNVFDALSDTYISYEGFSSLTSNQTDAETSGFRIPECFACGNYYVIVVADYENKVNESDENDNIYAFPFSITGCTSCSITIPANGTSYQSGGGSGNISVAAYKCCPWTATTNDSWINIINNSGYGNGTINFTVSSCNSGDTRTGTISVNGQSYSITQNCTETCNSSNSFVWAAQAGSATLSDGAVDLAKDADGNLYMTGYIAGSASFGNGIILTTPTTAPDIFVSKHNSSGVIQWAKQFSSSSQEEGTGIATDNLGNIYVVGYVSTSVTFGSNTITNNGTDNDAAFLLKLNSSGSVIWVQKINSSNYARPTAITIDNANNIFITGNSSEAGNSGFFITKYNTDGAQSWMNIYGMGFYVKAVYGIAQDNAGNLLICGRYMSNITLGSITLTATNAQLDIDGFVAKADPDGNIIWARKITSPGQGTDELRAITADAENNIYAAGNIDSTAIVENITIPLSPSSKTIIIKYDPDGNPVWVKTSTQGYQYNYNKVITINANEIYVTGNFSESMRIDSSVVTSAGSNDNFLARIDENGKIIWLKSYGGSDYEQCGGLIFDDTKSLYVSGAFSSTINLDNLTMTSAGSSDIYLAKFKQCDPPVATISYTGNPTVCPGEIISLSTDYCSSNTYQWLFNDVDISGANTASYTASQTGSYKVRVTALHACETLSEPIILSPQATYTFTGSGNWSVASNWSNDNIPPAVLSSTCTEIIIDPAAGGECVLDVEYTLPAGAKLIVMPGKIFKVPAIQ